MDDKAYCGDCFQKVEEEIENSYPQCMRCDQKIKEAYFSAFEAVYHKSCFLCGECGAKITDSYYMRSGVIICKTCQAKTDLVCIMCHKKGGGTMFCLGSYNVPFHKECFRCKDCHELVDHKAPHVIKDNDVWSKPCWEKAGHKFPG